MRKFPQIHQCWTPHQSRSAADGFALKTAFSRTVDWARHTWTSRLQHLLWTVYEFRDCKTGVMDLHGNNYIL